MSKDYKEMEIAIYGRLILHFSLYAKDMGAIALQLCKKRNMRALHDLAYLVTRRSISHSLKQDTPDALNVRQVSQLRDRLSSKVCGVGYVT